MKENGFVLDVNIWVSFVLGKQMGWLTQKVRSKEIEIFSCDELYFELSEVLNRPKFKDYFASADITESLALHLKLTKKVKNLVILPVFNDSDDDYLLALAVKGKATYIVTGDKIVLNTTIDAPISIITLSLFKSKLK